MDWKAREMLVHFSRCTYFPSGRYSSGLLLEICKDEDFQTIYALPCYFSLPVCGLPWNLAAVYFFFYLGKEKIVFSFLFEIYCILWGHWSTFSLKAGQAISGLALFWVMMSDDSCCSLLNFTEEIHIFFWGDSSKHGKGSLSSKWWEREFPISSGLFLKFDVGIEILSMSWSLCNTLNLLKRYPKSVPFCISAIKLLRVVISNGINDLFHGFNLFFPL